LSTSISVITVCFNAERTIADALTSVGRQRFDRREHLIIDGGSRDRTVAIAKANSTGVVRVISEPDHGIYDAMNKGIKLANNEVIGFLNADDMYYDDMVLSDVARKFCDPRIDAVFGNLDYISQDGTQLLRCWRSRPYKPGAFGRGWLPPHPTLFIRRSVYLKLGGFDLSYGTAADFDLMNRFFTRGRIRSLHIPRTLVRMRFGGVSNRTWRAILMAQYQNARSLVSTLGFMPAAYPVLKCIDRFRQYRRAAVARSRLKVLAP
jgi:glycosyltransferase involved in cell wall biosynthesis